MYTLRAHPAYISALAFTHNGTSLVSSDQQGWTIWWDLKTRRPVSIWKSHSHTIISTICRDDLVYTHARDNKLKVWRLERSPFFNVTPPTAASNPETYQSPWLVHTQDINALNFCSVAVNDNLIATPSTLSSDKVDIYTLEPFGRPVKALVPEIFESDMASEPTKLGIVMAIRLYDDLLVIGYESGHVVVYGVDTKAELGEPDLLFIHQLHKDPLQSITRIDKYIYTTGSDRLICRIDTTDWSHISAKVPKKGLPTVDHLGSILFTAGWDGYVRMWDADLQDKGDFKDIRQVTCLAVSEVHDPGTKRLKPLPPAFLAVAGKDARISLHPVDLGSQNFIANKPI